MPWQCWLGHSSHRHLCLATIVAAVVATTVHTCLRQATWFFCSQQMGTKEAKLACSRWHVHSAHMPQIKRLYLPQLLEGSGWKVLPSLLGIPNMSSYYGWVQDPVVCNGMKKALRCSYNRINLPCQKLLATSSNNAAEFYRGFIHVEGSCNQAVGCLV